MDFKYKKFASVIQSHPIFDEVTFEHPEEDEGMNCQSKHDDLMLVQSGTLYLWSENNCCFYTTNLKASMDEEDEMEYQMLLPSSPLNFKVSNLEFNSSGTNLLLSGDKGTTVLILPQKWGKNGQFEGGKKVITCRCIPVAERFYMTRHVTVKLLKSSWHPRTDCHVCTLSSDNTFRIFNINDPQTPHQTHKLNRGKSSAITSSRLSITSSLFSVASAIGESVISFDFASPFEHVVKRPSILKVRNPNMQDTIITFYPVYLLQGDGEVLLLLTNLTDKKYNRDCLFGPLTILPAAEDNYGVDACSILVLRNTTPNIIAIATSSGRIHHCVAIEGVEMDDEDDADSISTWKSSHLSRNVRAKQIDYEAPTLFVYETIEIDLELPGETSDPFNNHITLHADPLLTFRYHCCSVIGVHSAMLPWVTRLAEEFQMDSKEHFELKEDDACFVEHVVCTKPTTGSKQCSIVGFTFAKDVLYGPSMLCLTEDSCCTILPLTSIYHTPAPPLLTQDEIDDTAFLLDDLQLKEIAESNFQIHIQNLLRRNSSQPLLRSSKQNQNVTEREAFQLIEQATHVLREEYILKQKLAKDALEKRIFLLQKQKVEQVNDLEDLADKRKSITDSASQLAEDYDDCFESQENLEKRVADVLKHYSSKIPSLSKAEMDMNKEMKKVFSKLKDLQNRIKQVQLKLHYQRDKAEKKDEMKPDRSIFGAIQNAQHAEKFKETLLDEGQKISELIKKLNNLKMQTGV